MTSKATRYKNITATGAIDINPGRLLGVIINSHTAGTLKLWDSLSASGNVIMNTFTFATGSGYIPFDAGISYSTGLFATVGGTADITIVYDNY